MEAGSALRVTPYRACVDREDGVCASPVGRTRKDADRVSKEGKNAATFRSELRKATISDATECSLQQSNVLREQMW